VVDLLDGCLLDGYLLPWLITSIDGYLLLLMATYLMATYLMAAWRPVLVPASVLGVGPIELSLNRMIMFNHISNLTQD
jgi:hypothetical protein